MAVSKMKHLSVIAPRDEADLILRTLMWLHCVDVTETVTDAGGDESDEAAALARADCDLARAELERQLSKIDEAQAMLAAVNRKKKPFLAPKQELSHDAFLASEAYGQAEETVRRAGEIAARLASLRSERSRRDAEAESLAPWLGYDLPLGFSGTKTTAVMLGSLPALADGASIAVSLEDECRAIAERIGADGGGIYLAVTVHASDAENAARLLSAVGFVRAGFAPDAGTAAEEMRRVKDAIALIQNEEEALRAEVARLAELTEAVEVYRDVTATRLELLLARQKTGETSSSVVLSGYVPAAAEKALADELSKYTCAYELEDVPEDDEDAPVLLKTNGFASAFEPVISLYAYPVYGTFDPSFIMSIFYVILFGLMFADVGYGLILILGTSFALAKMQPRGTLLKFMKMFRYCGIASAVCGVLFGSYFGDLPGALATKFFGMAEAPKLAIAFDLVKEPMSFLVVSLAAGALHLLCGIAIQLYITWKDGDPLGAIFDQGSWFVLFAGIGLIFVKPNVGYIVALVGVAMLVLTQGRREKNPIMKLVKGVGSLYGLINYASDLLSYSRILSLGLASAVIASVVNVLGTMGGPTVGGVIGLVFAFVVGHTLNFALNVLGTFVHTCRLQYIEFFGKFYVDGGRPFTPLAPNTKYVYFHK